jgi:hypothetical protein
MSDAALPAPYKPQVIARVRALWDDTRIKVREISKQTGISYGSLLILARAHKWPKRTTARGNIRPHPKSTMPNWKTLLGGTKAKPRPHPKMRHPIVEARTYDPPTLAAITRLQQRGFVVYQTKPGEFMVGTKRLTHEGMMAKAVRYGADCVKSP